MKFLKALSLFLMFSGVLYGETLIPRRINIVDVNGNTPLMIGQILYSRLTKVNPLILSEEGETDDILHNSIELLYSTDKLTIVLKNQSKTPLAQVDVPKELLDNPQKLVVYFDTVAAEWGKYLGLVQPEVTEETKVLNQKFTNEAILEEKVNTKYQLVAWIPLSVRSFLLTNGSIQAVSDNYWGPIRVDFYWNFHENIALITSIHFEIDSRVQFYLTELNVGSIDTQDFIVAPGFGVQFRTLGRLSAEINLITYLGLANLKLNNTITYPEILPAGTEILHFYPIFSLHPVLNLVVVPAFSIKVKLFGINVGIPVNLSGTTSFGDIGVIINFEILQVGVSIRW